MMKLLPAETLHFDDIDALLAHAGLPTEFHVVHLPGGGNNRVYRIDAGGSHWLLKAYFHHPEDTRDRLGTEFSFSRFAWDHGLRCIAQPLARDDRNHLGLYEFVSGRPLESGEIGGDEVEQAIEFFQGLSQHKTAADALRLPNGSEAFFTLAEHLACVERRVARLEKLEADSPLGREAAALVQSQLHPAWNGVQEYVRSQAAAWGLAIDEPIPAADRCLSPSDFGYHNAILAEDGRLRFIDFEYAGWDDPAKTVCDFLCQPKLPVPAEYAAPFTQAIISGLSDPLLHQRRISLLVGVYRLKWCCIMLNDFLPVGSQRRSFAQDAAGQEARKRAQLEKVHHALQQIET